MECFIVSVHQQSLLSLQGKRIKADPTRNANE